MSFLPCLPFLAVGPLSTIVSSCLGGVAFCCGSQAASLFCKSCNCNSSIATRVGFALIFLLNSLLAWLMKSSFAIDLIKKWSFDYIKLKCEEGNCYGVLAVHRLCFALALFHGILSLSLIGVRHTRDKRAAIQNGFWGPKVLLWIVLVGVSFVIPNEFFIFWGNYVALIGATLFILLGLVLLVDFAHTWSETCLENWEASESNMWQWILIGSTSAMYIGCIVLTTLLYIYFAGESCVMNRVFITLNLVASFIITLLSIHPAIQEANPRSGLAQAGMVSAYCTYLVMSAVGNHDNDRCNPIHRSADGARSTTVVLGALFTFLAIAYSTSRAATQSKALVGKKQRPVQLSGDESAIEGHSLVTSQPSRTDNPRYQALLAAVEAGAIPASALRENQDQDEDEEDEVSGEERDDERTGTRYNYSWFHVIFSIGAMYVAVLLTDWNMVGTGTAPHNSNDPNSVYIGRSEIAMWMRIISGWICYTLYTWSLVAPVLLPDRFGDY